MSRINLADKYPVLIDEVAFTQKPSNAEAGGVANRLKVAKTQYLTINEILDKATQGQAFKLGEFDYTPTNEQRLEIKDLVKQNRLSIEEATAKVVTGGKVLKNTKLIAIDIDDDLGISINAKEMCNRIGALAMYYSSSHNTISKKNNRSIQQRYRLLFLVNEDLKHKDYVEIAQERLKEEMQGIEPNLIPREMHGIKYQDIDVLGVGMIFGSQNKDYYINQNARIIDAQPIFKQKALENFTKEISKKSYSAGNYYQNNDYIKMAKHLGDTQGKLSYQEWQTMVYGIWNGALNGLFSEEIALQMIRITDANRQDDKYYLRYKTDTDISNKATIATFLLHVNEAGYKFPKANVQPEKSTSNNEPSIDYKTFKIDDFMPKTHAYKLLSNERKNILVVSPTGSGKTQAFIEASKDYLIKNRNTVIYIASPTVSLAEQIHERINNGVPAIKGKMNVSKVIKQSITNNKRLFVGTYDKAKIVVDAIHSNMNILLIVDEAHKEVSDYGFRREAIDALFDFKTNERISKFIGLTGTPQEIDLHTYDLLVNYQFKNKRTVANNLQIIEYNEKNKYRDYTASIIKKSIENQSKVLCFLNNKEDCTEVAKSLRNQGYKVSVINSTSKKSSSYRKLIKHERIEDIDCILTTNALSDGISIRNNKNDVCIIAPSPFNAPFFNLPLIEQSVHRFRNKYDNVIMPIYVSKKILNALSLLEKGVEIPQDKMPNISDIPFNFEWNYEQNLEQSEAIGNYLKNEFKDDFTLFSESIAENLLGIYSNQPSNLKQLRENAFIASKSESSNHNSLTEYENAIENILSLNLRYLRYKTSQDKEMYYCFYPFAFIEVLKKTLPVDAHEVIKIANYLSNIDTEEIQKYFKEVDEAKKEDEIEKRTHGLDYLTLGLYRELSEAYALDNTIREDNDLWLNLKDTLHKWHYTTLIDLIELQVDYEVATKVLWRINNQSKVHSFKNWFKALSDLKQFEEQEKKQVYDVTSLVLNELLKAFKPDRYFTADERKETLKQVKNQFKPRRTKESVDRIFKRMFVRMDENTTTRIAGRKTKISRYWLVNQEIVKRYFGLTEEEFNLHFQM